VASPLIANVYLHYLFDIWADVWRRKVASGDVIVLRYADDLVVGFQHWTDAERFLERVQGATATLSRSLRVTSHNAVTYKIHSCLCQHSATRELRRWIVGQLKSAD